MTKHVISATYLDRQVARVAAALPGAGAYDAAPPELACPGFDHVTLTVSYTRAAAGGDMHFRVETSPDSAGTRWAQGALYAGAAVASGADSLSNVQREAVEYGSTAAGAEVFTFGPIALHGNTERIRIPCAESGALATPGTVEIIANFSCTAE